MANQQKDTARSDTASAGGARPVRGQSGKLGSEVAGKVGGSDAAARAWMASGTGLGEAASADDSRAGTSSGAGASPA